MDELGRLLAAAEAGKKHHGLTGHERALVYRVAVETGFRYSEIRSLTRAARDEEGRLNDVGEYGFVYDFHGLRHTFATLLNKAKVPLATAQRLMRHSDPKLTSKIYTHVLVDTKAEALDMLPAIAAVEPEKQVSGRTGTDDQPISEPQKCGQAGGQ